MRLSHVIIVERRGINLCWREIAKFRPTCRLCANRASVWIIGKQESLFKMWAVWETQNRRNAFREGYDIQEANEYPNKEAATSFAPHRQAKQIFLVDEILPRISVSQQKQGRRRTWRKRLMLLVTIPSLSSESNRVLWV